jgi:hypothetical protein
MVTKQFKPLEDPTQFSTLAVRRAKIVSVSPNTTVYINGEELAIAVGAEFGPGDNVSAIYRARSRGTAVAPHVYVTFEEE